MKNRKSKRSHRVWHYSELRQNEIIIKNNGKEKCLFKKEKQKHQGKLLLKRSEHKPNFIKNKKRELAKCRQNDKIYKNS